MKLANNDVVDHFDQYFEMVPATSDELKNEVYKLRYQVYCIENKFENCENYSDEMEFDIYDQHSVYYLIRHRNSGYYAATTRLILPNAINSKKKFPIEINSLIDNFDLLKDMPRQNLAELSRFCVSKKFRQRRNEQHLLTTNDSDPETSFMLQEKRSSSQLTLALFACAIKMSSENKIDYWYALMEPALMRVFSTLGVNFVGIGPLVDYHGKRRPCIIKLDDLLDNVAKKDLSYWNLLTNNGQITRYLKKSRQVRRLLQNKHINLIC